MSDRPYVNPATDKLRCPLLHFKDCVQEKCFFWTSSEQATAIYDDSLRHLPEGERPKVRDTCLLLVLSQVGPIAVGDSAQARDVVSALFSALCEGQLPKPQRQPVELSLYRYLREISEKLSELLKRTDQP